MKYEKKKRVYLFSNDIKKTDLDVIYNFLAGSYWAKDLSRRKIKKSIGNSYCVALYHYERQIGFARVVTDFSRFAYLADVFIVEEYQGKGLGKFMLKCILEDPNLKDVNRWLLSTQDAHGLYKKFGFGKLEKPQNFMRLKRD